MSNPSARLNGIFQDTSKSGGGNDALRYTAPREPSHQQQRQQQPVASVAPSTPSSVVFSTMVSLYQYDATARKYVQLGSSSAGSKAAVGCVIVGSETSYNLLFYNATKQHLCAVPIKLGTFKPTLQAKSYVNFYDEQGVNWSVKFPNDDQVAEFMRQIFMAKIHVEIWGTEKTVTKTNPSALIMDDLVFVKPETQAVNNGDTVAVAFSAWRVVGNASSAPGDIVTKYAPFEKAGDGELRKIRLGEGSERIKALEEGIVGMRKSGKRMVLAPPGKTNGQDWYLLEIELVKTKTGHGASQQKPVNTSAVAEETPNASSSSSRQSSRRRSSSANSSTASTPSSRSNTMRNVQDATKKNGDLVPYEQDMQSAAAKNEMELKELRLLQREHQLELQARALERERMNAAGGASGFGAMNFGIGSPVTSNFSPNSSPLFGHNALSGGRPMDTLLAELNAKMDYLIRITPGTSSNAGSAGPSDVSAVIRGVERLASENDRLLTQINSQHQQQSSFEKRCDELLEQNKRLQEEKRQLHERYQAAASAQLSASSELSSLVSARDAAVTQTSRLHAEYQQLLTAYYQLQQQHQGANETEEHKQALTFEREARSRAENQLANETQARLLAEQELALTKKQHDVALQVQSSQQSTVTAQLEQHVRSLEAQLKQVSDEKHRLQAHVNEQAQHFVAQSEAKQQLEKVLQQLAEQQRENEELSGKLKLSSARVSALETELEAKAATSEGNPEAKNAIDHEEKRHLTEQIELLQQQVKDLEQEKLKTREGGHVSPSGSTEECEHCAATKEREQAAERALAAAEVIKREAQDMLAVASHAGNGDEGERLVALFKESVNEMFFRFQDLFEEETAVDGKQVLSAIRKVLKSSTKVIIQQLQEGPGVGNDGNVSDGPPGPPLNDTLGSARVGEASSGNERHEGNQESSEKVTLSTNAATTNGEKSESDSNSGSAQVGHVPVSDSTNPRVIQYPSSDESDDDSEFHE